ncbi:hypothetical protein GPECTOR_23g143 [Gonium pectorale]|uniref:Uncharacterized protein n=1 Tax=Gonium pectorale TaxID=33097 RepID=A0A150GGU1_GONPE|nr:hypothetical protein GPECTOR_23g143 [Gonium pectorale]|eukprot:KXZ49058.1 hypothetical protein GPECTOR_23g143 [Gonium pectorale]
MAGCGRKARAVKVFVATRGSKILVDDLTAPDPKNVAKPKSTTPNFLSSQQLAERLKDIAAILQERGQELSPQDSARLALQALAKMCSQQFAAVVNSYNKKVQELTAQLDAEKTRGVALAYEIEQERAKVVAAQQSEMTAKGEAVGLLGVQLGVEFLHLLIEGVDNRKLLQAHFGKGLQGQARAILRAQLLAPLLENSRDILKALRQLLAGEEIWRCRLGLRHVLWVGCGQVIHQNLGTTKAQQRP